MGGAISNRLFFKQGEAISNRLFFAKLSIRSPSVGNRRSIRRLETAAPPPNFSRVD